jgi:hypothetical protein
MIPAKKTDHVPMYRVLEMVRDARGRLVPMGHVWHADLDRIRRFGRAIASNSASHRVVIADSAGTVLEELPVCGPDERQPAWDNWQQIPVPARPPLPPQRPMVGLKPPRKKRALDAPARTPPLLAPTPPPKLPPAPAQPATEVPAAVVVRRTPPRDVPVLPLQPADAVALPAPG